jgi:hypothetical protein
MKLKEGEMVAKMPTHHYIEYFNDYMNRLAILSFKEPDFVKFLGDSYPGSTIEDILRAKAVIQ